MSETVVGLRPWLPGSLGRSPWWTAPVPAERLAALRIGTGAVLLLDVLATYLPEVDVFFGRGSLAPPGTFAGERPAFAWPWSPLGAVDGPLAWRVLLLTWAALAAGLMVGVWPRVCAALAWLMAVAVSAVNPFLMNSGDHVRTILLLYLTLTPCGAIWSLGRRRREGPIYVYPWALRLLFVQLAAMYFCNGLYKLAGEQWRSGMALHDVLGGLDWTRWPMSSVPLWLTRGLTWLTLAWELGFPLLVMWPRSRTATLCLGVLFHLGTGLALQLAMFPLYVLCLYLPLVPWERFGRKP